MRIILTLISIFSLSFVLASAPSSAKPHKGKRVAVKSIGQKARTPNVGGYSYYDLDSQNLGNKYEFETPLGLDNARRNNANPYLNGDMSAGNMWWGQ